MTTAKHGIHRILEIGTLHGVATCYFAATDAEVVTVDLPESAFNLPSVDDALRACGLSAEIVRKPSRESMVEWIAAGRTFDLIYVDGSHTLGDALTDLLLADRLLVPSGWLICDDIDSGDLSRRAGGVGTDARIRAPGSGELGCEAEGILASTLAQVSPNGCRRF